LVRRRRNMRGLRPGGLLGMSALESVLVVLLGFAVATLLAGLVATLIYEWFRRRR
jgi:ABC-type antimicrobial peptide transport system permease subunit